LHKTDTSVKVIATENDVIEQGRKVVNGPRQGRREERSSSSDKKISAGNHGPFVSSKKLAYCTRNC
jgi:hypothetical protein